MWRHPGPVAEKTMAEVRVPYQVNDRQFEGMIVYDDTVQRKRPVVFMQPDWKGVCADTVAQARAVAGTDYVVLMADMFGAGYGDAPKTREQLAAGMKAVHDDFVFTLSCSRARCLSLFAEMPGILSAHIVIEEAPIRAGRG
jgi:dienelactone hydrolase